MVSTDPIADMLTRIRNAIAVRKTEVSIPHSKLKESIARLLAENKFIDGVNVEENGSSQSKLLQLRLNPDGNNSPITELVRLSKPGRRMYSTADAIPTVKQGRGLVIVSTSKGLMTGQQAKAKRLGGELICRIY
jgi:small subunit ribosomal protein S8